MTGLEESVKGKVFYKNKDGEYEEIGIATSIEVDNQKEDEYKNIIVDTETSFEIKDKKTIKKLTRMFKTDKEKKAEIRHNKNIFRNYINKKMKGK